MEEEERKKKRERKRIKLKIYSNLLDNNNGEKKILLKTNLTTRKIINYYISVLNKH